jgi:hypothetical protein
MVKIQETPSGQWFLMVLLMTDTVDVCEILCGIGRETMLPLPESLASRGEPGISHRRNLITWLLLLYERAVLMDLQGW